jgi:broad specificity phosphatase PhoE
MTDFNATLYWTRHAYSCANYLEEKSYFTWPGVTLTKDTLLTNTGIEQAKDLNKFLDDKKIKFDIIVCSKLRRAVETALYAFNDADNKQTLYVVPYIGENRNSFAKVTNIDASNIPSDVGDLNKYLNGILPGFNIDVNFGFIGQYENEDLPSYDNFVKKIVPQLRKIVGKDDFTVGIVSHSLFIIENLKEKHNLILEYKYKNTEMWKEKIEINIKDFNVEFQYVKQDCGDKSICPVYDGKMAPNVDEVNKERCRYHTKIFFGGNVDEGDHYYRKYLKYKDKYMRMRYVGNVMM